MYVPIRPATEGLLAIGMALISIRDGFEDEEHLRALTVVSFLVKESDGMYLRQSDLGQAEPGTKEDRILVYDDGSAVPFDGSLNPAIRGSFEVEGIKVMPTYQILIDRINEWDLDRISELTDVPVDTMEEFASVWSSGLSFVHTGFGPDHYSNGQTAYGVIFCLMDITGQEAKHGAGCSCVDYSVPMAPGLVGAEVSDLEGMFSFGRTIYALHFHDLMEKKDFAGMKAPKSLYIYSGNPITNMPDRQRWIRSLNEIGLIVVADMFMSGTALYADYVLPVAFLYERDDLVRNCTPHVKYTKKAVDPAGEAKSDFDIVTMLGKAMGFEGCFTQDLDAFLESCVTNPVAESVGLS